MSHRRRRDLAGLAGACLLAVYVLAAAADFVAPFHYETQHRSLPYAPPSKIHFVDAEGRFHLRPFIHHRVPGAGGTYTEDRSRRLPLRLLVTDREGGRRLFGVGAPGHLFLLGSDHLGRDLFSRWLYGARASLFAGLLAGLTAVGLGLAVGAVAGFFGGWIDEILMRLAELFMALPWIYLLIAARAFLPLEVSPARAMTLVVALIGLVGWPAPARLVRGVVLSARQRDYVLAARGFGASNLHLLRVHVLPQALPVALTQLALKVPGFILAEVTLSFLGLGVAEPVPSWGNLLADLQQYHVMVAHGWMFAPALALVIVIACCYAVAESLERRLGPTTV